MVTAELAMAFPVLLVSLWAAIGGIRIIDAQVGAVDAAREAARLSARGNDAAARVAAVRIAPGSALTVAADGDLICARVQRPMRAFGPWAPSVTVTGTSYSAREP